MSTGAVFTFKMHNSAVPLPGAKSPDKGHTAIPAIDWRIFGTKGEIRVTSPHSWALNAGAEDISLELWKVEKGNVVEVEVPGWGEFDALPLPARNIARLYEAFADAAAREGEETRKEDKDWYPDFEYALQRHQLIAQMYKENGFA